MITNTKFQIWHREMFSLHFKKFKRNYLKMKQKLAQSARLPYIDLTDSHIVCNKYFLGLEWKKNLCNIYTVGWCS